MPGFGGVAPDGILAIEVRRFEGAIRASTCQGEGPFSPEAASHEGPLRGRKFVDGAPVFADCALVVREVDVLREGVVRVYRAEDPEAPTVHRRGDVAEAEYAGVDRAGRWPAALALCGADRGDAADLRWPVD